MHAHRFSCVFAVTLVSLIFIVPTQSELMPSTNVRTNGIIGNGNSGHIPPELTLKYSTDFETVTKTNAHTLNMGIRNYFETSGDFAIWMEGLDRLSGVAAHSGSRCVGMETIGGYRNEFNILHMEDIVSTQYYVSVWLRFPSAWDVPSGGWYAFANPFAAESPDSSGYYLPFAETHIHKSGGVYDTAQEYGTAGSKITLADIPNYRPPIGQWFQLEYYVFMHPTQGRLKVWVEGKSLADISNLETVHAIGQAMLTGVAKIYFDSSITSTYQIWVDDLQIYGD